MLKPVETPLRRIGFDHEREAIAAGLLPIAGIDEAGRGPWAGPVVAAAVILDPDRIPVGIDDSKRLSEARREQLYEEICSTASWSVGIADCALIDTLNLHHATLWAMREACLGLPVMPKLALVDGKFCPELGCQSRAIVGGDALSLSIAAASIIAKVTRDRLMRKLAEEFPGYGFERHKGYGTREHQDALLRLGLTPHHRRSFAPIQALLSSRS